MGLLSRIFSSNQTRHSHFFSINSLTLTYAWNSFLVIHSRSPILKLKLFLFFVMARNGLREYESSRFESTRERAWIERLF